MITALIVAWLAVIGWGAWRARPRPPRLGRARPQRPLPPWVPAVAMAVPAAALWPPLGVATAGVVWGLPRLRAICAERARAAAVVRDVPDVVDLLAVAVAAGSTVPVAVATVGALADGPVGVALRQAASEAAMGRRLADALDDVPAQLGDAVRPLVAALLAGERYGAPLATSLDRLAEEARHARRRQAETSARRVPVQLLFPLVCCILPAFALLTVAPLIAGALRALRLS